MRRALGMNTLLLFIAAFMIITIFSGCGEAKKEAGIPQGAVSVDQAGNVGSDSCKVCHSLAHTAEFAVLAGQVSPNALEIDHECEACHGGGQYHYGMGPIPYPNPNISRCSLCHGEQVRKMLGSKHNGEEPANTSMATTGHTGAGCQACHTLEGYSEYSKVVVDGGLTGYTALDPAPATFHYPGCAACHNPLTTELRRTPTWDPNNNGRSDQFDMCTSCHKLIMPVTGQPIASGLTVNGVLTAAKVQHAKDWYRNITTTHYDMPETWGQSDSDGNGSLDQNSMIEGYIVRKNKDTACTDCHGHELFTNTGGVAGATPSEGTIHTEWAQSGHAGKLLSKKIALFATQGYVRNTTNAAAIMAVYTDDADGIGWSHYNWDQSSRAGCQRCHTATGASNYLSAPVTYVAANNDFSHMSGWGATDGSPQQELLYCWGCHVSVETGELRNPGAITVKSTGNPPVNTKATAAGGDVILPNAGKSNGCNSCHSGGGNMFSNWSATRIASHHAVAAGILYGTTTRIGYEFVDLTGNYLNYAIPSYITSPKHADIGMANGEGPCVSCHMYNRNHHFEAVDTAALAIRSQTLCNGCHTPGGAYEMSYTKLEEEKAGYLNAGTLLAAYIANTITNYKNVVVDGTVIAANDRASWWNFKLFPTEDPGAFVHNRYYAKRLMFDAIDWLQDGVLHGTIDIASIDPVTYANALVWLDGDAGTAGIQRP